MSKKSHNILIYGTNFVNGGAELMMRSIIAETSSWPNVRLYGNILTGDSKQREKVGLGTVLSLPVKKIPGMGVSSSLVNDAVAWIPKQLLTSFNSISDRDVDFVFEASGFAYSDQWGEEASRKALDNVKRWKALGAKVVFLPQAYGPFTKGRSGEYIREACRLSDLTFVRDDVSLSYLLKCGIDKSRLLRYPDFTNLLNVSSFSSDYINKVSNKVIIVPNKRVVDKGGAGNAYVQLLAKISKFFAAREIESVVLMHERNDGDLCRNVAQTLACDLIDCKDPIELKFLLSKAYLVAGSRFHALVSSLSQAVPSIAIGWSHKYEELFREYGVPENVLQASIDDDALFSALDRIASSHEEQIVALRESANKQKEQSREMWGRVKDLVLKD